MGQSRPPYSDAAEEVGDASVQLVLSPEHVANVARLLYWELSEALRTEQELLSAISVENSPEPLGAAGCAVRRLERDLARYRERLNELEWGKPRRTVTVGWPRRFAESVAQQLLDSGATDMREFGGSHDNEHIRAYRTAKREFVSGLALAAQIAQAALL